NSMSLNVSVSLDRKSSTYLTGETVTVEVRVENCGRNREILAWGSVQLTCDRTFGRRRTLEGTASTSISKGAANVFSSLPQVIFCDVDLLPGQTKTFPSKVTIPIHGMPPSFKGHFIRYTNRITVGVARIRSTVRMLHLPLRILSSVGDTKPCTPTDPFLAQTSTEPSMSELHTLAVDEMTAPRRPSVFSLTNERGKIATLTLFKKAFRLGEDVVGQISFAGSSVRTIQFTASLETMESLQEDKHGATPEPCISHVCKEDTECSSLSSTFFRLPLPMAFSPSFTTNDASFKWRLRFEFTISDPFEMEVHHELDNLYQAPMELVVDRLQWSCDLFVLPSTPFNIALTDESIFTPISISI
ncbi:hypothetical protein PFISCL1PPCAC_10478, partial [Pristionchus fissidentatus]